VVTERAEFTRLTTRSSRRQIAGVQLKGVDVFLVQLTQGVCTIGKSPREHLARLSSTVRAQTSLDIQMRMVVILCVIILICGQDGLAQPCLPPATRSWVHLTETYGFTWDTLWFGFDPFASYGIDFWLCEEEVPVPHVSFRFMDPSGQRALGTGTLEDYRHFSDRAQVDTHLIQFGVNWPTALTLHWSPTSIRALCDSAILVSVIPPNEFRLRLDLDDSAHSPPASTASYYLIRYGAIGVETAVDRLDRPTEDFRLMQNYPNPFNGRTRVSVQLPRPGLLRLEIYSIIGQILQSRGIQLDQGEKSFEIDATNLTSGVYVYRIQFQDQFAVGRFIIQR